MKKHLLASTLLLCTLGVSAVSNAAEIKTLEQKASYLMGLRLGLSLEDFGYQLDVDALKQGIKESGAAQRTLSDDEMRKAIAELKDRATKHRTEMMATKAAINQRLSEAFLAQNAKKDGVITTDSGLQYKIISEGKGAKPKLTDTVRVHYRGKLIDGTEFDSSYSHGGPATFPLNGVIPGWTEALQLLKEGTHAELYIPAKLAYGSTGMGPVIGPNSALIFDVKLLAINPPDAKKDAAASDAAPETEQPAAQ